MKDLVLGAGFLLGFSQGNLQTFTECGDDDPLNSLGLSLVFPELWGCLSPGDTLH